MKVSNSTSRLSKKTKDFIKVEGLSNPGFVAGYDFS